VLMVDAMHKANFASRLCHSCSPNCEAKCVPYTPALLYCSVVLYSSLWLFTVDVCSGP